MQALTNALFDHSDLEKLIGSLSKSSLTFIPTKTGWGPVIFDDDQDVD
jgi:hypothetical protein